MLRSSEATLSDRQWSEMLKTGSRSSHILTNTTTSVPGTDERVSLPQLVTIESNVLPALGAFRDLIGEGVDRYPWVFALKHGAARDVVGYLIWFFTIVLDFPILRHCAQLLAHSVVLDRAQPETTFVEDNLATSLVAALHDRLYLELLVARSGRREWLTVAGTG